MYIIVCVFVLRLNVPVNNFSVMLGRKNVLLILLNVWSFDYFEEYTQTVVRCISHICECESKRCKKVQVGKDQEKAQSEKDSHSKNRGGKKPN